MSSSTSAAPAAVPLAGLPGGAQPSHVGPQELQVARALARLRSIPADLEKYTFLAGLKDRNENVFYSLIGANMAEYVSLYLLVYEESGGLTSQRRCRTVRLIYTPVIGTIFFPLLKDAGAGHYIAY